jgi:hypothetical protein
VATLAGPVAREDVLRLLDLLVEMAGAEQRREMRDALLREAAEKLSGSLWARADQLEALIAGVPCEVPPGVRELVAEARKVAPVPTTARQLYRVLG